MAKSNKKPTSKPKNKVDKTRSHVDKKGRAYYKHTGRYNEVTKDALGKFPGSPIGD